ncbi:MAG: 50S ribosomal protein L28 [Planctomycetia bacterium]|nr:50S ribosomal protein L28 [Planctomycetia bacterium]
MSRVCEVCGKGRMTGNNMTTRGRAKHLKGVGTKVTGISPRTYEVNLQNVRVTTENGSSKTMRVCTQCLRCGAVTKRVHAKPFKFASLEAAK